MMTSRITAKEARSICETRDGEVIAGFMNWIYNKIRDAAKHGHTAIVLSKWQTGQHIPIALSTSQQGTATKRLQELGYTVKVSYGDQRDPYTAITISW